MILKFIKNYLRAIFTVRSTLVLLAITAFSVILSILRLSVTSKSVFQFMLWNLFLAFIPWFIATILYTKRIRNIIAFILLVIIWLAFFPNAPYVLTDIIHIGVRRSVPIWFDLIMLLSYGFAGILYGFISLKMIENHAALIYKLKYSWIISVILIYISCFGVYLGRFLRWNSWDLFTNLDDVMKDVIQRVANPFDYHTTWVFTILFGTLLNILFWSYKVFLNEEK
jgi:uncharacterized membrane protein